MAATPSPRPVRPSPSVVVADTDTGAPTAVDSTASASARRGPSLRPVADDLHRDVADLEAGGPHPPGRLGEQGHAAGARPLRVVGAEDRRRGRRARRQPAARRRRRGRRRRRRSARHSRRARPGSAARPGASAGQARAGARRRRCRPWQRLEPATACLPSGQHGLGQHQVQRPGDLERLLGARGRRPRRRRPARRGRRRRSPSPTRGPAYAVSSTSRRKPCGVCTARSADRSTVATTTSAPSTCLTVSVTGRPGTTASAPPSTAATTASTSAAGTSGRAASCTSTTCTDARQRSQGQADRVAAGRAAVDDEQLGARRGHRRAERATSATSRPGGAATTTRSTGAGRQRAHRVHEHRLAAEQVQRLGAVRRRGAPRDRPPGRRPRRPVRRSCGLRRRLGEHHPAVGGREHAGHPDQALLRRCRRGTARRPPSCRRRGSRPPGPAPCRP